MNKARMALRLGGALAVLLVLVSLLACSESTKHDETVSVAIIEQGSTYSRSLSIDEDNTESYTTKDSSELYWTYTAKKNDGYFTTGQTDETWISTTTSTDEEGNEATTVKSGLPSTLPGKFSVGAWVFTFNAYTTADRETDDDEDGYPDSLFYSGSATTVQLSSGGDNTVSVNVQLQEAVGDTGYLNIHDLVLKEDADDDESVSFTSSFSVWVQLDSDDAAQIATYTTSDDGSTWTLYGVDIMGLVDEDEETSYTATLDVGYHAVTVYTVTSDDEINGYSSEENILVQANLTTVLTGSVDALTEEVSISSDINVSYGSVTVSSATELAEALADSQISTVVLTDSVTLTSYLTVMTDSTIDLNGNTITQSSSSTHGVVVYSDDVTLVLTDSSEDGNGSIDVDYYPVYVVGDNADITIEGGTYSSDYIAVYIQGDNETITINDGTFSGPSCIAYSSSTSPDFDLTINGGTFTSTSTAAINLGTNNLESASITITGGTFSGGYYSINVNGNLTSSNNVTIDISGGEFKNEIFLAGYATTSITGGTFTGTDNMQALHVKSGSISITGGTFNHADYGTESYAATDWDYFMTGSGSMNHDEAIVIEANSNCSALTSVTLGNGFTANSGVLYVIDPDYDTTTKGTVTESISNDRTDVQQYTIEQLIYKRAVSGVGTAYFTSLESAQGFTSFDYGTPGDLYVYNNGWSVYSE